MREHKGMTDWPRTIPFDLQRDLEQLAEMRCSTGPQDTWTAVRDWLKHHGVTPPEHRFPEAPELKGDIGHG